MGLLSPAGSGGGGEGESLFFVPLYSELLIFGLNLVWGVAENNNTVSKYILFFSKVLTLCHPGGGPKAPQLSKSLNALK